MEYIPYGTGELEHITRDGEGYIYWKGTHVEHYSFSGDGRFEEEMAACLDLKARCEHLESIGVRVSCSSAIWKYSWFDGATADSPYLWWMKAPNTAGCYTDKQGRMAWICDLADEPKEYPFTHAATLAIWDGQRLSHAEIESDTLGGFYHPLVAAGWTTAQMGQGKDLGCVYATHEQVAAFLASKRFPLRQEEIQ